MVSDWLLEIDKNMTDDSFATVPTGQTFPYTFDSPIEIAIRITMTVETNGDTYESVLLVTGSASGYLNNNNMLPCIHLVQTLDDGTAVVTFYVRGWELSQDYIGREIHRKNGTDESNETFTTKSRTMVSGGVSAGSTYKQIKIESTLPVIFGSQEMRDFFYPGSDYYYYSDQWDQYDVFQVIDFEKCVNYEEEELKEEKEYEFSTIARNYTMDQYGNLTENTGEGEIYRGFKIKSRKPVSLYKIAGISDGILKMGINFADATACYYSTDYGNTWQMVPGQPTSLPFNFTYRQYEESDGVGTFWAAVGSGNNKDLLIFDNEEDSDEYNSGESDGRKASNYSEIINGDFNNPTGEDDEGTEFGEVYTRGFFSQQYVMNSSALQALANDLFDTSIGGVWEAIKKGLDMYGDNPIEAVMGLSFWPVDISSVFSDTTSASYIWFGGYGWETAGHGSVSKIHHPNGYKTLGSIDIRRTFRNWRDYSPYTRLYVSLPYCGVYELDLTRYYDKNVEVRYYFDTRTNGCIACLIADGHLMDYFNGQMGVTMPITLTDYAGYANSQIATLLGAGALAAVAATGVGTAVAGAGSAALGLAGTAVGTSGLAGAAAAAGAAGAAGGAVGIGLGGATVAGTALGAKTVYGLSQNNINKHNVTKGGSSSMINEYLPQYVEFIFEIQEDCAPDNYGQQYGYPSMKSGSVGSFQGFLKCQSVKLDCGVATENEKNQIKTMLLNGIYI